MGHILAIDQGTTGTTCVLVDASSFHFIDKVNVEFIQHYPKPGLVEHNLNDIWESVKNATLTLLEKHSINPSELIAIGITNQRETTCAFDEKGIPLHNAIVWQDRRTSDFCNQLNDSSEAEYIKKTTGLTIDPYFSGSKIKWLIDNSNHVKIAIKKKSVHFGTIDTYLLYRLTSGASFATEPSNSSRTMLMDLKTTKWDQKLLNVFDIPMWSLPKIQPSFGEFGKTKGLDFLPDGIPITGILGDQQAALFGQAGINKGDIKCTYGTGAFMLLNTGTDIVESNSGLLTTVAYQDSEQTYYALEGSCYIAGAAVQWLRDNLNIIDTSEEIEELAKKASLKDMEHIMFLPFFTGIGSPHWNSSAKAALIGMTRDTSKQHIARACLDGISLSINDLFEAMKNDLSKDIDEIKVDGGASANNFLMEIQSSISSVKIIRPKIIETTAYGAAFAAAIGAGIKNIRDIIDLWKEDKTFSPNDNFSNYFNKKKDQWKTAVSLMAK